MLPMVLSSKEELFIDIFWIAFKWWQTQYTFKVFKQVRKPDLGTLGYFWHFSVFFVGKLIRVYTLHRILCVAIPVNLEHFEQPLSLKFPLWNLRRVFMKIWMFEAYFFDQKSQCPSPSLHLEIHPYNFVQLMKMLYENGEI